MLMQSEEFKTESVSPYMPSRNAVLKIEPEIEDYLDRFCAPLVGKVSYENRLKMRADLKYQIEQVVVAYQELGSSRAQAIEETLNQFNQTREVPALQSPKSDLKTRTETIPYVASSNSNFALRCFGLSSLATLLALYADLHLRSMNGGFFMLTGCISPLIAGLYLGYRNPDRTIRATLKAHLKLTLPYIGGLILVRMFHQNFYGEMGVLTFGAWFVISNLIGGVSSMVGRWMRKTGLLEKIDPPALLSEPDRSNR